MIKKIYGFNLNGEIRLKRTYALSTSDEEIRSAVINEKERNIINNKETIVFNRFGNMFIAFVVENENEMYVLALINGLMSIYDRFFSKVCELHFIYNFKETHIILDNYIANGKCIENDPFEVMKHAYYIK